MSEHQHDHPDLYCPACVRWGEERAMRAACFAAPRDQTENGLAERDCEPLAEWLAVHVVGREWFWLTEKTREKYCQKAKELRALLADQPDTTASETTSQPTGLGNEGEKDGKNSGVHPDRAGQVAAGTRGRGLHDGPGVLAGSGPDSLRTDRVHGLTENGGAGESVSPTTASEEDQR